MIIIKKYMNQILYILSLLIPMLLLTANEGAKKFVLSFTMLIVVFIYRIRIKRKLQLRWMRWLFLVILYDSVMTMFIPQKSIPHLLYYEVIKYIGIFVFMFFYDCGNSSKIMINILLCFYFFLNSICLLDIVFGEFTRIASPFGGSYNSIAAYNLVGFPILFLENIKNAYKKRHRIWLFLNQILMLSIIIISGSRTAIPILIIVLLWVSSILLKKYKWRFFVIILFLSPFCVNFVLTNIYFRAALTRVIDGINMGAITDVRFEMYREAINIWKKGNIWFGTGDTRAPLTNGYGYAHNFILETLLGTGIFGCVIQIAFHVSMLKTTMTEIKGFVGEFRGAFVVTAICMYGMASLHPLMSSGLMYNFLYAFSLIALMRIGMEAKQKNGKSVKQTM